MPSGNGGTVMPRDTHSVYPASHQASNAKRINPPEPAWMPDSSVIELRPHLADAVAREAAELAWAVARLTPAALRRLRAFLRSEGAL